MNANDLVVNIDGLTRTFGAKVALHNVGLQIPRGCVFGLVGENGAGKTTIIKHIMGLFKAQHGTVRVFGMDPIEKTPEVLAKIGFLSEDRTMPSWMRVTELMKYTSAFYPGWDSAYAEDLRKQFELDPRAKVKHLSRGERAKLGLLLALAHRPDLLVLDEPSSGLDLLVRRQILTAIIRTVSDEGRTVLFSSHLLDEVERMADRLAVICDGSVVLYGTMEETKAKFHRLRVEFQQPPTERPMLSGVLWSEGRGASWTFICNGEAEAIKASFTSMGAVVIDDGTPSLDEIFLAHTGVSTKKEALH
jgi:ABC-2 type transport system ATP-binding protein